MAMAEVVLLSSSPGFAPLIRPPSPDLPSPSSFFAPNRPRCAPARSMAAAAAKRADVQTTLKRGGITKPHGMLDEKPEPRKTPGTKHSAGRGVANLDPSGGQLGAAVKRRTDWTPPKNSAHITTFLDPPRSVEAACVPPGSDDVEATATKGFGNLMTTFGFGLGATAANPRPSPKTPTLAPRKRRRVETGPTPASNGRRKPEQKKVKAGKKKARTVTEQATAPYAMELTPDPTVPMLPYFPTHVTASMRRARSKTNFGAGEGPPAGAIPVAGLTNRKGVSKAAMTKRKPARCAGPPPPSLLSPERALQKIQRQDLVFGTSSQLAREESPTMIRQLQEAMDLSVTTTHVDLVGTGPSSPTSHRTGGLWAAAARDVDGSLMEIETLDLSASPPPDLAPREGQSHEHARPRAAAQMEGTTGKEHGCESSSPFQEIGDFPEPPQPPSPPRQEPDHEYPPTAPAVPTRPDFSEYPTAQLIREISSFGFKAVKGRGPMIALLDRCWEGKHRAVLSSAPSHAYSTSSAVAKLATGKAAEKGTDVPAKKSRGRPRKETSAGAAEGARMAGGSSILPVRASPAKGEAKAKVKTKKRDVIAIIEEISDSDTPPTPSPPRRRRTTSDAGRAVAAPTLQLSTPPATADTLTCPLSPETTDQDRLFKSITRAIRSQRNVRAPASGSTLTPPSTNLTWHEKMLLYDPIVVEELAVWLNTVGLRSVGIDDEVHPGVCRAWCEMRSVCCISNKELGWDRVKKKGRGKP
ncbi:MAG: 5'-flap endonuclease [Thelocarpon superellum]|nr:MAG: 5'-flap endonuclease [Thelocarpon superellum]